VRHGGTSSASHASSLSYLATDTTARKYSHTLTAFIGVPIATIDAQVLEGAWLISRPWRRPSKGEATLRSKGNAASGGAPRPQMNRDRPKGNAASGGVPRQQIYRKRPRAFAARVARRVLPDATRDRGSERAELSTLSNMPPLDAKLHSEIAQWGLKLVNVHHVLGSNDCVDPRWREAARRAGRSRACRQQQG